MYSPPWTYIQGEVQNQINTQEMQCVKLLQLRVKSQRLAQEEGPHISHDSQKQDRRYLEKVPLGGSFLAAPCFCIFNAEYPIRKDYVLITIHKNGKKDRCRNTSNDCKKARE